MRPLSYTSTSSATAKSSRLRLGDAPSADECPPIRPARVRQRRLVLVAVPRTCRTQAAPGTHGPIQADTGPEVPGRPPAGEGGLRAVEVRADAGGRAGLRFRGEAVRPADARPRRRSARTRPRRCGDGSRRVGGEPAGPWRPRASYMQQELVGSQGRWRCRPNGSRARRRIRLPSSVPAAEIGRRVDAVTGVVISNRSSRRRCVQ
jgi:hypothetical protein